MSADPAQAAVPVWTMADRYRKAREHAGYKTQAAMATETGISLRSITNYETGSTKPLRAHAKEWAMATGVSLEWLEHGTAPKLPPMDSNHQPAGSGSAQVRGLPARGTKASAVRMLRAAA